MEQYCMREELTKRQQVLFDKLDDEVLYACIEDRQGGTFGTDRSYSVKGWVDQALQWEYMDDCLDEDQTFINMLLKGGEEAIRLIDEFWDITIVREDKIEEDNLC